MSRSTTGLTKDELKEVVRTIMVGQGNEFIKELLRDNRIKIGTTKADFITNLNKAIDDGILTQDKIEKWLDEVEGWGHQHIYLYPSLDGTSTEIKKKILSSPHANLLNAASHEFPDDLQLSSITLSKDLLSLIWHKGILSWTPDKKKDFQRVEGADLYKYTAQRQISKRAVVRFEYHFGKKYSAIFMQQPIEGDLHMDVKSEVWKILKEINLINAPLSHDILNKAVNKMRLAPDQVSSKSTTLRASGGHVQFVSDNESGISEVDGIKQLNASVDESAFYSAEGRFKFSEEDHNLERDIKIETIGAEGRIRIWVQCKREDVYYVTESIWLNNQP